MTVAAAEAAAAAAGSQARRGAREVATWHVQWDEAAATPAAAPRVHHRQRQLQQSLQPRAQAAPAAADPTASQRGPASKFGVRNPNLDYVHLLRHRSGCLLPGTRILNLAFDIQNCILLLRSRAQYCTKDLSADVCTKLINTWPSPSLPVKVITCKEQRRDGLLGWLYLSVGIFRSYSFSQEQHASVTRRSRVLQARLCLANVRLNLVPGPHDL